MKSKFTAFVSTALLVAASTAFSQSGNKTDTPQDPMTAKDKPPAMTMQQCKDHMEMSKKAGTSTPPTADMRKMDMACADMMKKGGTGTKEPTKY